MPTWPLDLPALPFAGVSMKDDDAVLRTPMDAGPQSRRNRFTAITKTFPAPMSSAIAPPAFQSCRGWSGRSTL